MGGDRQHRQPGKRAWYKQFIIQPSYPWWKEKGIPVVSPPPHSLPEQYWDQLLKMQNHVDN